ncbi:MAG: hypothetical protein AAGG80_05810, partial [Pseudomonadota bacterium]
GAINFLPTNIMESLLEHTGTIIGANLISNDFKNQAFKCPDYFTFLRAISVKLGISDIHLPKLTTLLINSYILGASHETEKNIQRCNIYIEPDPKNFSLVSNDNKHKKYMIEEGYRAAMEQFEKYY